MQPVRLGEISFINALPFALTDYQCQVSGLAKTVLPPTGLNQLMLSGELDISPVSSACYLRHQDRFVLLPDLSISAAQPVESVLFFLPGRDFKALTPETAVFVPDTSETSIALLRFLIADRAGFKPTDSQLRTYPAGDGQALLEAGQPLLAIGNEALRLKRNFPPEQGNCIDLAAFWQERFGLPFVFAVWVARAEWAVSHGACLQQIIPLLVSQKHAFQNNPQDQADIIAQAQTQCPDLPEDLLRRYLLQALSYDFTDAHRQALSHFETILKWLDNDDTPHRKNGDSSFLPVELLHR